MPAGIVSYAIIIALNQQSSLNHLIYFEKPHMYRALVEETSEPLFHFFVQLGISVLDDIFTIRWVLIVTTVVNSTIPRNQSC